MSLRPDEIKPYLSLLLAICTRGKAAAGMAARIAAACVAVLRENEEESPPRKFDKIASIASQRGLEAAGVSYALTAVPGWLRDSGRASQPRDRINHCIIVLRHGRSVGIHFTEKAAEAPVAQALGAGQILDLAFIPAGRLNAALVRGDARTLWLSGTHRRVAVKADSKVLAGGRLQRALDPVGDQSYYFTAARTRMVPTNAGEPPLVVGVTPRRSKTWVGVTRDWSEFQSRALQLFKAIEDAEARSESVEAPLPILASPTTDASAIKGAYDLSFAVPEESGPDEEDADQARERERWAHESTFDVRESRDDGCKARLSLLDEEVCDVDVRVAIDAHGTSTVHAEVLEVLTSDTALADEARKVIRRSTDLRVRFDSGHTVADGRVYLMRYRTLPFDGWQFEDFSGYDIHREKPTKPKQPSAFDPDGIGQKNSLFCWIKDKWPLGSAGRNRGWLACDDGSNEMADFIHFQPVTDDLPFPTLTLIHVKATKATSATREISLGDYELVVSQAVKNLRFLDDKEFLARFREGGRSQVQGLVWHNGVHRGVEGRRKLADLIEQAGVNCGRHLVILQPRVSKAVLARAQGLRQTNPERPEVLRLAHLETLLLEARVAAQSVGATFRVVAPRS